MLLLIYFLLNILAHGEGATFSPDVKQNELRFPYGVNFKYNGILHHNMARVWIVTKFQIPKFEDLLFKEHDFMPECDFSITSDHDQAWTDKFLYIRNWMHAVCESVRPQLKLIKEKEKFYKNELKQLLDEEILSAIPALGSAGRTKRFAAALIPAIAGLVTLAVESVSGYLQSKRNRNIAFAVRALNEENGHLKNKLNRYHSDMLLYGEFSMNSTEEIIETLNDMYSRHSQVEDMVANLSKEWPQRYLSDPAGAAVYAGDVAIYLSTVTEKYLAMLRDLLHYLHDLVVAIKTLSEGKIPIELIPPKMLEQFTLDVERELADHNPDYMLAFPHISYYYDMELVTFGVDVNKSLVITFPIFIKPIHSEPFTLYEIETVDVPVDDLNPSLNSFTRVQINKPYLAANSHHYIQLQIQELHMCKVIQKDYFCEELFMVKHANLLTCESAMFYKANNQTVSEVCEFAFSLNKTVIPSVLDGGDQIVLANLDPDKSLTCLKQITKKLPGNSYILTNRSLLCLCNIQSGLSFIPQDIGACANHSSLPTFRYTTNLAFLNAYTRMSKLGNNIKTQFPPVNRTEHNSQSKPSVFPFDLGKTMTEGRIKTLRQWSKKQRTKLQNKTEEAILPSNMTDVVHDYFTDITYMTVTQGRITATALFSTVLFLVGYVIWLTIKIKKLRVFATSLALQSIPLCKAQGNEAVLPKVVCHNMWLSVLFTCITVLGIIIWLVKVVKGKSLFKGYKFSKSIDLYLIVCDNFRYIPIKVKTISGHMYRLHLQQEHDITEAHIKLERNFLWDTLTVTWSDVTLTYAASKLNLPCSMVVPLTDKFKLRRLLSLPYDCFLMAKEGKEWKSLTARGVDMNNQVSDLI